MLCSVSVLQQRGRPCKIFSHWGPHPLGLGLPCWKTPVSQNSACSYFRMKPNACLLSSLPMSKVGFGEMPQTCISAIPGSLNPVWKSRLAVLLSQGFNIPWKSSNHLTKPSQEILSPMGFVGPEILLGMSVLFSNYLLGAPIANLWIQSPKETICSQVCPLYSSSAPPPVSRVS